MTSDFVSGPFGGTRKAVFTKTWIYNFRYLHDFFPADFIQPSQDVRWLEIETAQLLIGPQTYLGGSG